MSLPSVPAKPPRAPFSFSRWLRNAFFSGVAVVLPFAVTFWLIWALIGFIDGTMLGWLPDDIEAQARQVPGTGVVLAVLIVIGFGALTANLIGRILLTETEMFVNKVPLVRTIYGGAKQLFQQIANRERSSFKEAVLVEFPGAGLWSIGFVTNDDGKVLIGGEEDVVSVYIPLAPIPTTGYLIYVKRSALRPYPLGVEDALKRVLSLGAMQGAEAIPVTPNRP